MDLSDCPVSSNFSRSHTVLRIFTEYTLKNYPNSRFPTPNRQYLTCQRADSMLTMD